MRAWVVAVGGKGRGSEREWRGERCEGERSGRWRGGWASYENVGVLAEGQSYWGWVHLTMLRLTSPPPQPCKPPTPCPHNNHTFVQKLEELRPHLELGVDQLGGRQEAGGGVDGAGGVVKLEGRRLQGGGRKRGTREGDGISAMACVGRIRHGTEAGMPCMRAVQVQAGQGSSGSAHHKVPKPHQTTLTAPETWVGLLPSNHETNLPMHARSG